MKILKVLIVMVITVQSYAQHSIGVMIEPSYNVSFIGSSPAAFSDSIKSIKKNDGSVSYGIEYKNQFDRDQAMTLKIGYNQANFLLVKNNLQLFDIIHPTLPEIKDLSFASTKNAYMHHRFKYVGLQFLYSGRVKIPYTTTGPRFDYFGGVTYNYLFQQDIRLRTEGFALQGKFIHKIKDEIYFVPQKHTVNINLGMDVSYPLNSTFDLIGGAVFNIPLLSNSTNDPKVRIFLPAARLGARIKL